jgi:cystathionine beta-lyase
MKPSTRLVHFDACPNDPYRPVVTPIYQTATFEQESAMEFGRYDYSRSGNPTRTVLEGQLAVMEKGTRAFCFASGMAAIAAVTRLLRPGDEILACDDLYGGTCRLFSRILSRGGIAVRYANASDLQTFRKEIGPRTRLIHIETPTNPLLRVIDIRTVADLALRSGALLCVDNSIMSPYLQNPLDLGADIVVHSGTKFLCGHSDVTAGVVVVRDRGLADAIYLVQNGEGAALAPFDSYLLLRGMKTLAIRMDRQQAGARQIAEHLASHPLVTRVHYPACASERDSEIHAKQARGTGAVVSFETASADLSRRIVEALRLFRITVSFGSVSSSVGIPARMSHASIPHGVRLSVTVPEALVRLSVGIEDVDDLIADVSSAFDSAVRHAGRADAPPMSAAR